MRITDYAIRHRVTVYVLAIIFILFGGYSYWSLPREAAPDITIPFIIVSTLYIGAPPQDVENLVTRPIEKELQGLENVKEIRSTSAEGGCTISIEFNPNVDIDDALQKVKDKVDLAKPEFPEDTEDPIVMEINFSNIPMMIVNLAGDYGLIRLKEIAEDLQDDIETIPGILEARIAGGLEREVKVDVDPDRLTAITTILGLIPLSTGISFDFFTFGWEIGGRSSQWWGPMGVAVIFGLAFATALTLIVVPVIVSLIWKITGIDK